MEPITQPAQQASADAEHEPGGFHELIGYHLVTHREGKAVIELAIQPRHLNRAGVIHGGVFMALLDIVLAEAGLYCDDPQRVRRALTLSLSTTFTGQCSSGVIRAIGVKRAGGRRIFNSSGEIRDHDENLLAIGEGTFRLRSGSENPA